MTRRLLSWLVLSLSLALVLAPTVAAQEEAKEGKAAPAGALAPAQTLSGTIMMVDASKKILVVKGSGGVPYNFVLSPSTRITAGKERLKIADLASRTDKQVTVRFLPTRRGNLARSVEVTP